MRSFEQLFRVCRAEIKRRGTRWDLRATDEAGLALYSMLRSSLTWSRCCCCTETLYRPNLRLQLGRRLAHRSSTADAFIAPRLPTIFAPATGKGKSAIAILRISGDDALEVWRRMTASPRTRRRSKREVQEPPERRAVLRKIVHPETDEVLDEGVVVYFPRECGSSSRESMLSC